MASPEIFTEDSSATVDCLGLQAFVDRERFGAIGICGLSGMAITAAGADTRIKAVATLSMYDRSRSISQGYRDSYTPEQRLKIRQYLSRQRWKDAETGTVGRGPHEISFDAANEPITKMMPVPEALPAGANRVLKAFFDYYVTRVHHDRAINFVSAWTATTPIPFFEFELMAHVRDVSPRPLLLVAGENAHSSSGLKTSMLQRPNRRSF